MQNFGLTDSKFKYVDSIKTDIRQTFLRHGFIGREQAQKLREAQSWMAQITGSRKS